MGRFFNKVIFILITSDFFLNLGWGVMGPVFSIFVVQNVTTGSVSEAARVAGLAAMIFWITKSLLQIPIGRYLDRNHGEIDDFWFMITGTFLMALVPLGYLMSSQAWHIYLLQAFYAVAAAINYPSWSAIFTRHMSKGKEAFQWGSHSTFLGLAAGVAAGGGGVAVSFVGFNAVFIFVSVFTMISGLLLWTVRDDISRRNKKTPRVVPFERHITKR